MVRVNADAVEKPIGHAALRTCPPISPRANARLLSMSCPAAACPRARNEYAQECLRSKTRLLPACDTPQTAPKTIRAKNSFFIPVLAARNKHPAKPLLLNVLQETHRTLPNGWAPALKSKNWGKINRLTPADLQFHFAFFICNSLLIYFYLPYSTLFYPIALASPRQNPYILCLAQVSACAPAEAPLSRRGRPLAGANSRREWSK